MRSRLLILSGSILAMTATVALADDSLSGTVTMIDRTTGVVAIQQTQSGTVGASAAPVERFKIKSLPDDLHAGDKVTVSYTQAGETKTITKLDKQ